MVLPAHPPTSTTPSETPAPLSPPNGTPPPSKNSLFEKVTLTAQNFFVVVSTFGVVYAFRDSLPKCHCGKCKELQNVIMVGSMFAAYGFSQYVGSLAVRVSSYFSPKRE